MVTKFFSPERIESMKPRIKETVNYYLEEMIKGGCEKPVDLVEKFALPIPSRIIYDILGIPFEDAETLTQWNAIRTNGSSTAAAASNANK